MVDLTDEWLDLLALPSNLVKGQPKSVRRRIGAIDQFMGPFSRIVIATASMVRPFTIDPVKAGSTMRPQIRGYTIEQQHEPISPACVRQLQTLLLSPDSHSRIRHIDSWRSPEVAIKIDGRSDSISVVIDFDSQVWSPRHNQYDASPSSSFAAVFDAVATVLGKYRSPNPADPHSTA